MTSKLLTERKQEGTVRRALIGLIIVTASLSTGPTSVAATACDPDERCCKENDYGYGYEYPDCGFSCIAGDQISVTVSQTYNDYVDGTAKCGGGAAYCTEWDGRCGGDGTLAATNSEVGDCSGEVYMGDYHSGKATVTCYATAQAAAQNVVGFLGGTPGAPVNCPGEAVQPQPAPANPVGLVMMMDVTWTQATTTIGLSASTTYNVVATGIVMTPHSCWNFDPHVDINLVEVTPGVYQNALIVWR